MRRSVCWVWGLVVVGMVGAVAVGQVSYDEAMRRLRERQEERARQAATNPAVTQPSTRPVTRATSREGNPAAPPRGGAGSAATSRAAATVATSRGVKHMRVKGENPPAAVREFRGVWVASVDNANWPSRAGLSVEEQKAEMIEMLDECEALGVNAVVFQVRPCADALYVSELEPWSEYLTGVQGKAPEPLWDPLAEWIAESHKRGMELHAWFNPYRVKHAKSTGPISEKSVAKTHPEVVKSYGGYLWMDPGEAVAERQTLDVVADIVRRYDVDGIHTDDYYYPYKVKDAEFPDGPSWERYKAGGGKLERADWRRENVNRLVERIYATVHGIKPWVKVGYAPFGIWKPGVPAGIKGMGMFDGLYADGRLWLNKGWCDYMSPQLYWKIGGDQDYVKLLDWWVGENKAGRAVWPGLSVGRHSLEEVSKQIRLAEEARGTSGGEILWSVNSVLRRGDLYEGLREGAWAGRAQVPAMGWLGQVKPAAPSVTTRSGVAEIEKGAGEAPGTYGVWARYPDGWEFRVVWGGAKVRATLDEGASEVVVSAVSRTGIEGERVRVKVE